MSMVLNLEEDLGLSLEDFNRVKIKNFLKKYIKFFVIQ